jgi:predicted TIM-barrel fold metal-dependent hydrolase
LAKDYPDAYLGAWACIDPWKGNAAIIELERAINELGMIGLKFQQVAQGFFPNDRRFYPIYETCDALKVPVQFHMGTTGLGAGGPGGFGYKLKYTKPIPYLDDVAADFPNLTIIGCHAAWPWQDEMIAVLLHKGNVFNEMSGWSPKYFTPALKREIGGRLQDKFMFGTDYPMISHERLLKDWESEGYSDAVLEKVFLKNAQRILKL